MRNVMRGEKNGGALLMAFYFGLYAAIVLTIALNQPLYDTLPYYQNPPDEHSRYLVPLYICNHGTIPTGFEEELRGGGVYWSYGFYTLLPYIVQGYVMRAVKLLVTDDPLMLLYTARTVNVASGAVMAYVVLLIGRKLFGDRRLSWLFSFLVTFLPQSIFLHSYVNPDSMALMATTLIIYGLLRGYGDGFSVRSLLIMSVGIIVCALSYYNAYGAIVGCILIFAAYFVRYEDEKRTVAWRELLCKGAVVSVLVLICISWQFIRNYILYDGDIIGLETKENFVKSFGIVRKTMQSAGQPVYTLLWGESGYNYLTLVRESFIAKYGSMSISAPGWVYLFYTLLLGGGAVSAVLFRRKTAYMAFGASRLNRILFHAGMVLMVVIPFILLVRYAYTVDYQAQGRYLMPGLIPIMFYTVYGIEKFPLWRKIPECGKTAVAGILICGTVVCNLWMVYKTALPLYLQTNVLG